MVLNLNRTEDPDLIGVFYGLISPTPGILCRNAINSLRLGLPFPEPMINTKVEVPKDARKRYVIKLSKEEERFLHSFRPRQRNAALRTLLRRVLWSYCLEFLKEDRETQTGPAPVSKGSRGQVVQKTVQRAVVAGQEQTLQWKTEPKPEPAPKPRPKPKRKPDPVPEPEPKAPALDPGESLEDMSLDLFNNIIGG